MLRCFPLTPKLKRGNEAGAQPRGPGRRCAGANSWSGEWQDLTSVAVPCGPLPSAGKLIGGMRPGGLPGPGDTELAPSALCVSGHCPPTRLHPECGSELGAQALLEECEGARGRSRAVRNPGRPLLERTPFPPGPHALRDRHTLPGMSPSRGLLGGKELHRRVSLGAGSGARSWGAELALGSQEWLRGQLSPEQEEGMSVGGKAREPGVSIMQGPL
ncbi:uncharacterized protein LOC125133867 [Phacochoerus africanus]|uniref:uncharacterized protein LOC125133867 n=1 Tax=Phacochoerus africanus TaxID=41426 RepID=UPI001FD91D42|nr:uncharacterized protein LOC125133867 [Phacochoerus africanus]